MKKILSLALSLVMLFTGVCVTGVSAENEVTDTLANMPSGSLSNLQSYEDYMAAAGDFSAANGEIVIDAVNFAASVGAEVEKVATFKPENGKEASTVIKWTNEDGAVTYNVTVPADGLYTVKFNYYAMPSRKNPVAIGLKVDGKVLFDGMQEFELPRLFTDNADPVLDEQGNPVLDENGNPKTTTVRTDGIGNEFAAEQVEVFMFQEAYFTDPTGLESSPYALPLTAGAHTLTVESVAEPFALDSIVLCPPTQYKPYSEVSAEYDTSLNATAETIKIEGEDALYKNTYSLIDQYDQTDPSVSSESGSNPYLTRINYVGDVNWASPGQRLTWEVNVPSAGYYKLAFRYQQSHVLNGNSYRRLMVNGKVPFAEAESVCFTYDLDWKYEQFGDDKGNPYLIYLDEGTNYLSMEVNLGEMTSTVRELKEVVYHVGNLYRDMIKITGESPDNNRDYALFDQIPNFLEKLEQYSAELNRIAAQTEELAGQAGGTNATTIRALSEVLDNMHDHKRKAHQYKSLFYNNYTSVSALVYTMMEMGLNIDYIEIAAPEATLVDPSCGWWDSFTYSVERFLASFSADYNNISGDLETEETITIWANWGRDQIRVLNNLIQSSFTPQTGIGVNLKMSNASYVHAILSGKGPDCSLHMARSEPVNLALRGAMVDLTQFEDYDKVMERFMTKDAALPFTFDQDSTDDKPAGVYALPDTLNFYMLFYRTDIFEEFGLTPPTTWEEFLDISSVLYRNNLQASLPYTQITTAAMVNAGVGSLSILPTLIMQMGGKIYKADGSGTELSSATSIKAFEFWTDFFNEYKFPVTADFFNRFRIGTMPMGIQNYTMYIQLTMAAPEVTGKWKMVPIPGFKGEDGTINNCQAGSGTGCGILKVSPNPDLGWEFLKWWTSAETQLNYSNNCESILGVSGRVATANPEALKQMGWDKDSLAALIKQWERMQEVPEIPGSYYTARSIDQAYWNVVNNSKNAKDMMIKWAEISDAEIERKRNQYNVK
ncbi:MAG: extracellular solute-binding protein [Clostridia bacterium]|nr:extracellular solute-binding protein [Clostridia bacterium]